MPNISLTAPSDYGMQTQEIDRQRKLAQLMLNQAMQAPESYQYGGMGGKMSWTQALAKALQGGMAGYQEGKATEAQKALSEKYQQDLTDILGKASQAMTGTPERPAEVMPEDVAGPPQPAQAAVAANPMRAAMLMMRHPATQALGQQEAGKAMEDMRANEILKSIGVGTQSATPGQSLGAEAAAGGALGPTNAAASRIGTSNAGLMIDPIAAKLMMGSHPGLLAIAKAQEERAAERAKPVVNRGSGLGTMSGPNGEYVPSPSSTKQAAETAGAVETAKSGAAMPYSMHLMKVPVYLPNGDQIEVMMNATQANQYQTTHQLPPEIAASIPGMNRGQQPAQQPQQSVAPQPANPFEPIPQDVQARRDMQAANINAGRTPSGAGPAIPSSTVLGAPVVGRGQTQAEQIIQEGQRSASKEAGQQSMGIMYKNYERLQDVPQQLQNIESAKALVGQAGGFMGPGGESLLGAAKFLNDRLGTSINTEGVKGAEEIRTRIFMNVMDNLKKMDAQPSQLQQQIMQQALGSLGTDPAALPKMLDAYGQALSSRVQLHNQRVVNAKKAGVNFSGGDPIIDMGAAQQQPQQQQFQPQMGGQLGMPPAGAVRLKRQ